VSGRLSDLPKQCKDTCKIEGRKFYCVLRLGHEGEHQTTTGEKFIFHRQELMARRAAKANGE